MAQLSLVPTRPKPPLSLMSPEFQPLLTTFNDLTRDIRNAGVAILALHFLDKRIVINAADVDVISRRFAHEIRSQSHRTTGDLVRHSVQIRNMYVTWFSRIKEQNQ